MKLHELPTATFHAKKKQPITIKEHWPLYIPVLVTLTEDDNITVRQRGINILSDFLTKCPSDILHSSGIDAVFQASIFPSLLLLPTLTPEDESVPLLRAAYRTLLTLAVADPGPAGKKRRALLDKMLRDGVLTGYFHASQHIRVVEVLMQSAAQIIESLQIYTVKHLQVRTRVNFQPSRYEMPHYCIYYKGTESANEDFRRFYLISLHRF